MKQKLHYFLFFLSLFFCNAAYAQSTTTISLTPSDPFASNANVSEINISNAKIINSTTENVFNVSFEIGLRNGIQSNVGYAIQLVDKNKNIVDEQIYPVSFTLDSKTTISQNILYSAPDFISSGRYEANLISRNDSGLLLATILLGNIDIKNNDLPLKILSNSCVFIIKNSTSTKEYKNTDIIKIYPNDKINIECSISSDSERSVILSLKNRSGSELGKFIPDEIFYDKVFDLKKGLNKISFVFPNISKAQIYYAEFGLKSISDDLSSNRIFFSFTVSGDYGSIINAFFDKDNYKRGDTARLDVSLVSSALASQLQIEVSDKNDNKCADVITTDLSKNNILDTISVPISKNCSSPKAILSLLSTDPNNGKIILDIKNINTLVYGKDILDYNLITKFKIIMDSVGVKTLIIMISIILSILLITLYIMKRNRSVLNSIAVLIGFSFFSLFFSDVAYANSNTYTRGPDSFGTQTFIFNQNFDKTSYSPGDILNLNGTTAYTNNSSKVKNIKLSQTLIYESKTTDDNWTFCANENGQCALPGGISQVIIKYGADSRWHYLNSAFAGANYPCNNTYFGDPAVGTAKSCYYKTDARMLSPQTLEDKILYQSPGHLENLVIPLGSASWQTQGVGTYYIHLTQYFEYEWLQETQTCFIFCWISSSEWKKSSYTYHHATPYTVALPPPAPIEVNISSIPDVVEIGSTSTIVVSAASSTSCTLEEADQYGNYSTIKQSEMNNHIGLITGYGSPVGSVKWPNGMTTDLNNNLYIADTGNHRIQKFPNGNYSGATAFGVNGSGDGQFNSPTGIVFDSQNNIYVADSGNSRIQKLDVNGNYISKITGSTYLSPQTFSNNIRSIAIDPSDNLYIVDSGNHRVIKMNSGGSPLVVLGGLGSSTGKFNSPGGIALDSDRNIYVVDSLNYRIQKFSYTGDYIFQINLKPYLDPYDIPNVLEIDLAGNLYVGTGNSLLVLNKDGLLSNKIKNFGYSNSRNFGSGISSITIDKNTGGMYIATVNSLLDKFYSASFYYKTGNLTYDKSYRATCSTPIGSLIKTLTVSVIPPQAKINSITAGQNPVLYDRSTNISWSTSEALQCDVKKNGSPWVTAETDVYGRTITDVYKPYAVTSDSYGNIFAIGLGAKLYKFDQLGKKLFEVVLSNTTSPNRIAVDKYGYIYVSSQVLNRITKYDSSGVYVSQFGSYGSGNEQFVSINDIAIGNTDYIYVADYGNFKVKKFTLTGVFVDDLNHLEVYQNALNQPTGLHVDKIGNVYIVGNGCAVQKYDGMFNYIRSFGSCGIYNLPNDVTVNTKGEVYVTDYGAYEQAVHKFDSSGNLMKSFGDINAPSTISVDKTDNIYVVDNGVNIQKFTPYGSSALNGSFSSGNLKSDTIFDITCYGQNNIAEDSLLVEVVDSDEEPKINLEVSPVNISYGQSATLKWSSVSSDECSASSSPNVTKWTGIKSSSQSTTTEIVNNMIEDTKFTLYCSNNLASASSSVSVIVGPQIPQNVEADSSCGEIHISWTANNADSFQVYRDGVLITPQKISSTSYIDTDLSLVPGQQYSYTVRSFRNSMQSGISASASTEINYTCNTPGANYNCVPVQNGGPGGNQVYVNKKVSWTIDGGIDVQKAIWTGTNVNAPIETSGRIFEKIYTTVGVKNIQAVITGTWDRDGQIATLNKTCSSTITVKLDPGSAEEI